eukprot:811765-Rhodomonas_salina.2
MSSIAALAIESNWAPDPRKLPKGERARELATAPATDKGERGRAAIGSSRTRPWKERVVEGGERRRGEEKSRDGREECKRIESTDGRAEGHARKDAAVGTMMMKMMTTMMRRRGRDLHLLWASPCQPQSEQRSNGVSKEQHVLAPAGKTPEVQYHVRRCP